MNHKDRKDTFRRSKDREKSLDRFILYVEGRNTEKSYFDLLKRSNCKVIPVVKRGQGISSCIDFVNESEKAWTSLPKEEKEKFDQKWLVFDADGRSDFSEGIKLAKKKGFGVAFSNMCIEYWFMLHFFDHDGSEIPMQGNSHSAAQIKSINEYIRKYNKAHAQSPVSEYSSSNKKVEEDFFELMLAIDHETQKRRIVAAFERAKAIHEVKKRNGDEGKESVTTIYELLLKLGTIEERENGLGLFGSEK